MLNQLVSAGEEGQLPSFLQCLHRIKVHVCIILPLHPCYKCGYMYRCLCQDMGPTANLVLQSQYPSLAITYSVLNALCARVCLLPLYSAVRCVCVCVCVCDCVSGMLSCAAGYM